MATKTKSPFEAHDAELRELYDLLEEAVSATERLMGILPPKPPKVRHLQLVK